jgi:DNA-binding NarL/FixJ family response regulator
MVNAMPFRCVLVDDNNDFLASAAQLLESQGVDVIGVATTSADALRLAETLGPDVALVDIELDEEDGIELAQELAARTPSIQVVLISSYEREDLSDLIAGSPAVGFLPKPVLSASAIDSLLSGR